MKILWFANTPCSAVEKLEMNLQAGGWLSALENELNKVKGLDLGICFYTYKNLQPFNYNGTQFYPIYRKSRKSKLGRYLKRILNYKSNNDDEHEVKEFLRIIERFNPDLIHVHGTEDNFGLVNYYTKIPVIISIQGILSPYYEKYFSGIPYNVFLRYENILYKPAFASIKQHFRQFKYRAIREQKILINSKYIIGRTDWDRRIVNILAPKSVYFFGNEILRSKFYSNIWNKNEYGKTIQIVTLCGDTAYKGFETIIKTAEILKKNTKLCFKWKVIGVNEKSGVVNIIKKWKKVDFKSINVQLLGMLDENNIIKVLVESDIYCQVSHIENSPNSLCEAMILGMPIIATYAGGTSSILENKKEGILVQDGDSYCLAGTIIELLKDFSYARKLGIAARTRAIRRHESTSVREEYLRIYKRVIDGEL